MIDGSLQAATTTSSFPTMETSELEPVRVHNLAVGPVAEWLVWTRLVATSGGDLHVFLPLDDRGVDGIVHRISTDSFARVQVKGRSVHRYRGIEVQVREDELADDRAVVVVVAVDLVGVQLGALALIVPAPAFFCGRLATYTPRAPARWPRLD
jgi:hypothetical protein